MKRPNFLLRSTGTTKNVCLTPNKPSDGSVTRTSQTIQSGRKSESQAENLQKRQKKTELGENHTIFHQFLRIILTAGVVRINTKVCRRFYTYFCIFRPLNFEPATALKYLTMPVHPQNIPRGSL